MAVSPEAGEDQTQPKTRDTAATLLISKANRLIAVPPSPLCGQKAPGNGWTNFSVKGQIANILDFEAYSVSVRTSWKVVIDHRQTVNMGVFQLNFMDTEM